MEEDKLEWSNEQVKFLLETCIEEVNKFGRKGGSMYKRSWVRLGKALKKKFNMDVTQKQLEHAFDDLKAKYEGWIYLKNKTRNLYNPETNSFTLGNAEWDEFIKSHPNAGSLRTHPLLYPSLCASLFDESRVMGRYRWTSTQKTPASASSSSLRVQIEDTPFDDLEDDDGSSHQSSELSPSDSTDPASGASTNRPSKRAKTSVTLDELALDMQKALQYLINRKEGPTVDECYEKLKLLGLDPTDPLFLAAFFMFGQSMNMREAWMTLPPIPEVLKGWIKMGCTRFGLFK